MQTVRIEKSTPQLLNKAVPADAVASECNNLKIRSEYYIDRHHLNYFGYAKITLHFHPNRPIRGYLLHWFHRFAASPGHAIHSIDHSGSDTSLTRNERLQERLRKNPNITSYQFIKLNPLASSQKDGNLSLHIPDGPVITAAASHVEYESANEYEWIGKTDEGRGTVIVISKAGRVCAHISTPAGVYEIFPAPLGLYCLQVIDPEKAWDVGCATTSSNY